MRDHHFGVQDALADPVDGIRHVLHVAARVRHAVVHEVVDVVEVERGHQALVGRAGEEVEAAAEAEKVGALRDERRHRRHQEDVVVAAARRGRAVRPRVVRQVVGLQLGHRVGESLRVAEVERHAVHGAVRPPVRVGEAEDSRRTRETRVVDVRDDEAARTLLRRMAGDVDATEPHRAAAGHQEHRAPVDDADLEVMRAEGVVVVRAERRDDAADRLGKRALEEGVAVVGEETPHLHHDGRQVHVRRLAADRVPGVADGLELVSRDVEGGLEPDALADLEPPPPFRADLADDAGDLVPEHRRPRRDVARHALVPRAERHGLVVAQADRVRHELDDDALVARALEFDVLQPRVARAVEPPCLRLHQHSLL